MSDQPTVSVVIPAYNAAATIEQQFRVLEQEDYEGEWEIVVADNGSTDRTARVVESWSDRLPVRLVDASDRRGPSAARNIGAAAAKGDIIAFTDADDVVFPGWLAAAASIGVFGTGPVVKFTDGQPVPRAHPHGARCGMSHLGFLPYSDGSNFIIRAEAFAAYGGFDEARRTGEDVDLSWRMQLDGISMEALPAAVVASRVRTRSRSVFRQYFGYGVGDVELARDYRARGLPGQSAGAVIRSWLGLVARVPLLWRADQRERWLHQFGRRLGRVVGSVKYRKLWL
jgi:glycosyltransferase involved in cell wall biosynthesis